MLETVGFLLIVFFVLTYSLTRDIFHPAVIVNGCWMVWINLYAYADHPLWALSDKFCNAILLWIIPFSFFSTVISSLHLKNATNYSHVPIKEFTYNKLYRWMLFFYIFFCLLLVYYAGGLSIPHIRNFLLRPQFPPLVDLSLYASNFFIVYTLYGLLNIDRLSKKKVLISFILLLFISMLKGNKTAFLSIFVGSLYIIKRNGKLKLKYLLGAIGALSLLITLLTIARNDMASIGGESRPNVVLEYIYIYTLSPLTAFDYILHNDHWLNAGASGSGTFAVFYKILNAIGGNYQIADLGEWIYVPLITNVYTAMRGCYLDWGMNGILFISCLLGIIWGYLYAQQKRGDKVFILFYSLTIPSLYFQLFGDYFFYGLSNILQYFIFSVLITIPLKIYKIRF